MDILIKNGTVVTDSSIYKSDILLQNGKISQIEKQILNAENCEVIDASGKYIFPGGIDPHVHMDLPTWAGNSCDNFESGSKAAIAGGTTCFLDFVTPARNESYLEALKKRKIEAENSWIDYGLHMSITSWNENSKNEIKQCVENEGVTSFKAYMAYKKSVGIDDSALLKAMDSISDNSGILMVHCENGDLIEFLENRTEKHSPHFLNSPDEHAEIHNQDTEIEAVSRILLYHSYNDCLLYLVHISLEESINLIKGFNSPDICVETCPHYLLLDDSRYKLPNFEAAKYVISPPLRDKSNNEALWEALGNFDVTAIGSDHCPFNFKGQKDFGKSDFRKIPNGAGGVEHRMPLLYTYGVEKGKISLNQFVYFTSTHIAEVFGLNKRKGFIEIGYDADLVIWDSEKKQIISAKNHHQRCDYNIYEGMKIKGLPEKVIVGGELVFDNGNFIPPKRKSEFLFRELPVL